jgi:hypothetical protein
MDGEIYLCILSIRINTLLFVVLGHTLIPNRLPRGRCGRTLAWEWLR